MTHTAAARAPFVLKGWHVLIAFVIFFSVDIAINVNFIMSAYRTFPGETVSTPYEDGVNFNKALQARKEQSLLGWRFTAGSDATNGVRVDAFDHSGAPLRALRVTAHLRRPATDTGERDLALAEAAPGIYRARGLDLHGAWDLELTARDAHGHIANADRRLVQP